MSGWLPLGDSWRNLPRWFLLLGSIALLLAGGMAGHHFPPSLQQLPHRASSVAVSRQRMAADPIIAWQRVDEFDRPLAQFQTVFWEPRDTESLRRLLRETSLVQDKRVLEIGTGSGLLALSCLRAGARQVVATDVNPAALANARYNAELLGLTERLELRQVPLDRPGAFTVVRDNEQFDFIVSNPPWENQRPGSIDQYALFDEGFQLLRSLLEGLRDHLEPDGRALLAYGSTTAIRELMRDLPQHELEATLLDERHLDELPETFLPGMLIEVRVYGRSTSR